LEWTRIALLGKVADIEDTRRRVSSMLAPRVLRYVGYRTGRRSSWPSTRPWPPSCGSKLASGAAGVIVESRTSGAQPEHPRSKQERWRTPRPAFRQPWLAPVGPSSCTWTGGRVYQLARPDLSRPTLHVNVWLDFKEAFAKSSTSSKRVAADQGGSGDADSSQRHKEDKYTLDAALYQPCRFHSSPAGKPPTALASAASSRSLSSAPVSYLGRLRSNRPTVRRTVSTSRLPG
jgi:hypothetical protein